jgi:ribonuclease J
MVRNSEIAARLGVLDGHQEHQVELDELLAMAPASTAIISTGSQGEPYAALSLMAIGEHASIALDPSDTVIISATPIPGNETRVSRVINNLMRSGVTVFHGRNSHVHVSGHAAQEELKTFYNVVRPQALIPVHGEYRHLAANAALGRAMGIAQFEVCTDGDAALLEGGRLEIIRGAVPAGYVYVDGPEVGGADEVLRDRRHLADDGVLIITVGVDKETGEIVIGPDVDSHGVTAEEKDLHDLVARSVTESIGALEHRIDADSLRRRIRNRASRTVRERAQRRPVVIPVVIEV